MRWALNSWCCGADWPGGGTDWTTVVDQSHSENVDAVRTATGDLGHGIRFLRVSFTGWPQGKAAALAEIAVGGGTA